MSRLIETYKAIINHHGITGMALDPWAESDQIHQLASRQLMTLGVYPYDMTTRIHPRTIDGYMTHLQDAGFEPGMAEVVVSNTIFPMESSKDLWVDTVWVMAPGAYIIIRLMDYFDSHGTLIKHAAMTRAHLRMNGIEWIPGEEYLISSRRMKSHPDRPATTTIDEYVYVGRKVVS